MTANPLPPNPYAALGVTKSATLQEIRSAHRKLVLKCHPDKVQDPTLKALKQDEFQKVQQAYEILSSDHERQKYDDLVKLDELRKEAAARYPMNSSASRTPPRTTGSHYNVNIRTAEPRPSTFSKSAPPPPQANAKFYTQQPHPRSWEEHINSGGARSYAEDPRRSRRPSSYEEEMLPRREKERSSKDKDRRRKEEALADALRREEEKRAEARRERDREREEKQAREQRRQRKEQEKKDREAREKQESKKRREEVDERRYRTTYVEESPGYDEPYTAPPKAEKKSSSRKHEATVRETPEVGREAPKREKSKNREEAAGDKLEHVLGFAQSYLRRSKAASGPQAPGLQRAHTMQPDSTPYAPAVPTPPPAGRGMPMPPVDADTARRPSAKASTRRSSHDTPKSSKEKSKKSSTSKEAGAAPVVDAPSSSTRVPPSFTKNNSAPPAPESPPREPHLGRSKTTGFVRTIPPQAMPSLARAQTWYPGTSESRRERSRSRPHYSYSEDDSEDDRHHRRSARRARSPDPPMPPLPRSNTVRYSVTAEGRTKPVVREARHPEEMAYFDSYGASTGFKAKIAKPYGINDVNYGHLPHTPQSEHPYGAYAVPGY